MMMNRLQTLLSSSTCAATLWSERKQRPAKGNVFLTDGKGGPVDDSKLAQLCQDTVEAHTIVAFIKGTRQGKPPALAPPAPRRFCFPRVSSLVN